MQTAARLGDAAQAAGRGHVPRLQGPALEVADDQQAVLGAVLGTGGPAPAAAAVTELRYSQSRSIDSSSLPSMEIRATKAPAGVVTL